jgi:hypothetical protein
MSCCKIKYRNEAICFCSGFITPLTFFIILYFTNIIYFNNITPYHTLHNYFNYNYSLSTFNYNLIDSDNNKTQRHSFLDIKKNIPEPIPILPAIDLKDYVAGLPWKCIPNITFPVRVNFNNNAECLSFNALQCYDSYNMQDCSLLLKINFTYILPLECGNKYLNLYGSTGYTEPSHWCYITALYYNKY